MYLNFIAVITETRIVGIMRYSDSGHVVGISQWMRVHCVAAMRGPVLLLIIIMFIMAGLYSPGLN